MQLISINKDDYYYYCCHQFTGLHFYKFLTLIIKDDLRPFFMLKKNLSSYFNNTKSKSNIYLSRFTKVRNINI